MPDFIATLIAAIAFCLGLMVLNTLTRWTMPFWPIDLDENGLLQIGGSIVIAHLAWRRAILCQPDKAAF